MASPLHKTPLGLLELFRLKTLGRAPDMFGDTVLPTVEVLETYAAPELAASATNSSGPAAINGTTGLGASGLVTQLRWIWGIGGVVTLGAAPGTFITWVVGVTMGGGGGSVVLGCGELRTTVAGQILQFGFALPRPLVLRAGSSWNARVWGDAAGADHIIVATDLAVPGALLN